MRKLAVIFVALAFASIFSPQSTTAECDAPLWLKPGIYAKYLFTVTRGDVLVERNVITIRLEKEQEGKISGSYRSVGTSNFTVPFSYDPCKELPKVFPFYVTLSQLRNLSTSLSPETLGLDVGKFSVYRWKYYLRNQMTEYEVTKWVEVKSGLVMGEIAKAREVAINGKGIRLVLYRYTLIDTNVIELERRFSEKDVGSIKEIIQALKGNETATPTSSAEGAGDGWPALFAAISLLAVIIAIILYYSRLFNKRYKEKRRRKGDL